MSNKQCLLLFGASGAIGSAIAGHFLNCGWDVVGVSRGERRSAGPDGRHVCFDPFASPPSAVESFDAYGPYSAVCWAQGRNATDSVYDVHLDENLDLYKANCLYILATLKILLDRVLLAPAARLCIISSIWQNLARQNKLSYCMSKAALQGLVLSAATDLAKDGFLINAILPGALDTPMTRKNLDTQQLEKLSSATCFNRLPALEDVAGLSYFLCSEQNSGITGQFIAADLGFSHVRLL